MTKREPLMTEAYFDEDIVLVSSYIRKRLANMASYSNATLAHYQVVRYRLSLWSARYSRGYAITELHTEFLHLLGAWEDLRKLDEGKDFANSFKNELGDYVDALGVVSQAHLVKATPEEVARLLVCIGNEGQDLLFERLAARVVPGLVRRPAKKLLYPKAYQPLYDALDAPAEQQPVLMQQFLKNWYRNMRQTGWYDSHKGPEGGGFAGYWCWEAAGVTVAFGIDDAGFRDLPHYPRDLADYARQHP